MKFRNKKCSLGSATTQQWSPTVRSPPTAPPTRRCSKPVCRPGTGLVETEVETLDGCPYYKCVPQEEGTAISPSNCEVTYCNRTWCNTCNNVNYNADKSVKCNVINMMICFGVVDSHIFLTELNLTFRSVLNFWSGFYKEFRLIFINLFFNLSILPQNEPLFKYIIIEQW